MAAVLSVANSAMNATSSLIKATATWAIQYFGARISVNEGTTDSPQSGRDKKTDDALAAKQLVFTYFGPCNPVSIMMAICVSYRTW
jgi:hypothetical protein